MLPVKVLYARRIYPPETVAFAGETYKFRVPLLTLAGHPKTCPAKVSGVPGIISYTYQESQSLGANINRVHELYAGVGTGGIINIRC